MFGFNRIAWITVAVLGALLAVATATAWGFKSSRDAALTQRDEAMRANKNLAEANGIFQKKVPELIDRLWDTIGAKQDAEAAARTALAELDARTHERDMARAQATKKRETLYATDADARAWAAAPVPPGISRLMRDRWAEAGSAHVLRGPGRTNGAPARAPHRDPAARTAALARVPAARPVR